MEPARSSRRIAPSLVQALVEHLTQEEQALTAVRNSLRDVRGALLENDLDDFTRALVRQSEAARASEEIQTKRGCLLQEAADSLDTTPEALTLQALAELLPGEEGAWFADCRERLRKLADESQRLNRQNAVMVYQSVDLTRQVLAELFADGSGGESYTAAGARRDAVGRPIIELGG